MAVDQKSLDRIRNATFPTARRGYDKGEVERFLEKLADWLETGAGDESRTDAVKRELERIGQRTSAILAQAEESASQIRTEAEREASELVAKAKSDSKDLRAKAKKATEDAESKSRDLLSKSEQDAKARADQILSKAKTEADKVVSEAKSAKADIETVIEDLNEGREEILADLEKLAGRLRDTVGEHSGPSRPAAPKPKASGKAKSKSR